MLHGVDFRSLDFEN